MLSFQSLSLNEGPVDSLMCLIQTFSMPIHNIATLFLPCDTTEIQFFFLNSFLRCEFYNWFGVKSHLWQMFAFFWLNSSSCSASSELEIEDSWRSSVLKWSLKGLFRDSFFFFPKAFSLVCSPQRKYLRELTCSGGWTMGEALEKGFHVQTDHFSDFCFVLEVSMRKSFFNPHPPFFPHGNKAAWCV